MAVKVLDIEEINRLRSETRQRGQYDREFGAFIESGEPGINVPLDEGPFKDRKAQSVKTSFEQAKKRYNEKNDNGGTVVDILVSEGAVYLLRNDV